MRDRDSTMLPAEASNRDCGEGMMTAGKIEDRASTRRAVKAGITNTGT